MNMTKMAKKFLTALFAAALFIALALTSACSASGLTKEEIARLIGTDDYPVESLQVTYSVNADDLREVAGDSDYIIVAEVTGYENTTYSASGVPITEYAIRVQENIKGALDASRDISMLKEGGINEANTAFVVYEGDLLPQVGKTYIFCLYGQSGGGIRACGKNYTLAIENADDYKTEQNYLNILDAYANEIISSRTKYKSQYEAVDAAN